ncbi:NHL repeat-containing protein [Glarea lozoyensis ATCC 20868]|uniref:NHL repeat-containing protein n=1 Tax=Glarea lozoyensis (strain ATCC 20868 / MF5171) TaxID=1116229 RepID=S3DFH7_GLAL2|nr:NHL repeat-containing protein [Glarea lozoyensis ATCC 20868]EPE25393.1 NHL repeat-containing protein [Glarea lozoyensis ATCC 20868]
MHFRISISLLLTLTSLLLSQPSTASKSVPSTTVIYQFPKSPTWIENLAILPNNQILLSLTTAPEVRLLDPNPPNPSIKLLHTFPYLSALGLVSLTPNLIYLILGNSTSTSFGAGTFAIWTLNPNTPATTTLLTTFPSAGLLNGLTLLCPSILALSDSTTGCIRLLNTYTNQSSILSRAPEMAPPTPFSIGINGLRTLVLGNRTYIYFANTGLSLFGRLPVDLSTLVPAGDVEILARNVTVDDFALDVRRGVAWLAGSAMNALLKVGLAGGEVEVVVGGGDGGVLPGPTSVAVGEGGEVFVSTSGRVDGVVVEGGKVVRVDVGW